MATKTLSKSSASTLGEGIGGNDFLGSDAWHGPMLGWLLQAQEEASHDCHGQFISHYMIQVLSWLFESWNIFQSSQRWQVGSFMPIPSIPQPLNAWSLALQALRREANLGKKGSFPAGELFSCKHARWDYESPFLEGFLYNSTLSCDLH